jgi:tetratricopeptide (TPR) repeat protein
MRARPIFLCLAAAFSLYRLAAVPAYSQDDAGYREYVEKKKSLAGAADAVKQWESRVKKASTTYDRLKAQRQLEMARKAYRDAQRDYEGVLRRVKPGDKAFRDETRFKERDPKDVKDVGPSGPAVPFVTYSEGETTKGGSTGEVVYNKPRDPNAAGRIRADPGRWKIRDKPAPAEPEAESAVSEPSKSAKPAGQKRPKKAQYVVSPEKLGAVQSRRTQRLGKRGAPIQNIDYIGKPVLFTFEPFDYDGTANRGDTKKESLEEIGLIKSVTKEMSSGQLEKAKRDVERLMTLRPEDARVFHLASLVYNKMGKYEDGAQAADTALRIGMRHPAVYESLAVAQLRLGRYSQALESANSALEIDPARELAGQIRASALEQLGSDDPGRPNAVSGAASASYRGAPGGPGAQSGVSPYASSSPGAAAPPSASEASRPKDAVAPWVMGVGAAVSFLCAGAGAYLLKGAKT